MEIKTILITQARTGSTRLPGKILMEVDGIPLLKIHLDRLSKAKKLDKIIVATTVNKEDDIIENLAREWGFDFFRGSENDVLDRFYKAVEKVRPTWIVRVTSDCPLLDPELIDAVITFSQVNDVDYASNGMVENFPDGQDVEVFKFSALEIAWRSTLLKSDREHVTPYIRNNSTFNNKNQFRALNFPCKENFNKVRMTVDEKSDLVTIETLIKNLGSNSSWEDYTNFIIENPNYFDNQKIIRNEGYLKSLKND